MKRVYRKQPITRVGLNIALLVALVVPVAAEAPSLLDYIPEDVLFCQINERVNDPPEEPTFRNFEQSLEDWFRALNDIVEWRILREELETLQANMGLPEDIAGFEAFASERSAFAIFGLGGGTGPRIPAILYICQPRNIEDATATLKATFDSVAEFGLPVSRDSLWVDDSVVDSIEAGIGVPGLGLSYVAKGDLLFICSNSAILDRVLDLPQIGTGRLADDPDFTALKEQLPDTYDKLSFANWKRLVSTLKELQKLTAFIEEEEERALVNHIAGQVIALIGTLRADANVSVWEGKTRVTAGRTLLAEQRPEIFNQLFQYEPRMFPLFRLAPRGAENVWATNILSLPDIWKAGWTLVDSTAPNKDEIRAGFAEFEEETGLDIEEDFLSWMGTAYGMVKYPVDLESVIPINHFAVWIEVTDQEKAKAWLPKVVELIRKNTEMPLQVVSQDYEGHTISQVEVPIPFFPYNPCVTVVEDGLLIASYPAGLHEMLDVYDGRAKGLETDDSYEKVDPVLTGESNFVQFVNTSRATRGASKTLERAGQMAGFGAAQTQDVQAANVAFGMQRVSKLLAILSICQAEAKSVTARENVIISEKHAVFRDLPSRISVPTDMRKDISLSQIHLWLPDVIKELNKKGQRDLALLLTQKMAHYLPEQAEQAERLADEIKSAIPSKP